MSILRGLLYVLYKNRRFKKLIIPVIFFFTELGMFAFLSVRLWGNTARIISNKLNEHTAGKFMLVVKFLSPYKFAGHLGSQDPVHNLMSKGFVCVNPDIICNVLSILCTFVGLLIAYLWIARFFKMNSLNVNWWIWLAGCLGGHVMFYFLSLV
jgi:hypothetical protein